MTEAKPIAARPHGFFEALLQAFGNEYCLAFIVASVSCFQLSADAAVDAVAYLRFGGSAYQATLDVVVCLTNAYFAVKFTRLFLKHLKA